MAKDRLKLHEVFVNILGSENCYYCPPNGMQMEYPCIIYKPSLLGTNFADNIRYIKRNRYDITIVDRDPDSELPNKLLDLPTAYFETYFTSANLNYWQLTLYF